RQFAIVNEDPLALVGYGGNNVLYGIREQEIAWRLDIGEKFGGKFSELSKTVITNCAEGTVVYMPAAQRAVLVDSSTGVIKSELPFATQFTVTENHILVLADGKLRAFRIR